MNDKEKLEVLDGSRSKGARPQAAVRLQDLRALLQLRATLKSAPAAGATPTKAEFDALVSDLHNIDARLKEIADVVQRAYLP